MLTPSSYPGPYPPCVTFPFHKSADNTPVTVSVQLFRITVQCGSAIMALLTRPRRAACATHHHVKTAVTEQLEPSNQQQSVDDITVPMPDDLFNLYYAQLPAKALATCIDNPAAATAARISQGTILKSCPSINQAISSMSRVAAHDACQ